MNTQLKAQLNNIILNEASKIDYIVKPNAPSNEIDLHGCGQLVIWSGASDNTIYGDAMVNHAIRAIHDTTHLRTGLGFGHADEIELGRINALQFEKYGTIFADIIYTEVARQAAYHKDTGLFVVEPMAFLKQYVKGL
jgi:hypothetical protein